MIFLIVDGCRGSPPARHKRGKKFYGSRWPFRDRVLWL